MKLTEKAIFFYKQAIESYPYFVLAYYSLGTAFMEINKL